MSCDLKSLRHPKDVSKISAKFLLYGHVILYHKSNLVYIVVFPQFSIFQKNNSAETSVSIFFTSRHYYLFEKLKIVEKQLHKLICSYGKVSHTLKRDYKNGSKRNPKIQF